MTEHSSKLLRQIGMRVRRRRLELGLTLKGLAHRSTLSPRFLSDIEAGKGNIAIGRLEGLANAIDLPLVTLIRPMSKGGVRREIGQLVDSCSEEELCRLLELFEVVRGRRTPQVIALMGVRGAGKTTVGGALAEELGLPFVEIARRIEQEAGMTLGDLFTFHGEAYYRRLELRCLSDLFTSTRRCVAALPGGVVTNPDAMNIIREACHSVWLKAAAEDYWRRVFEQGDTRPTAGRDDPMSELRALIERRAPLYGQADLIVETSKRSVDETIVAIVAGLEALGAGPLNGPLRRQA